MNIIFLGLVIWNVLLFLATVFTGMQGLKVWHFSLGVFTGVFTCFTHSLVFIQLIGTGKGIKEAVSTYSLPESFIEKTKKFKSRAFPYAMYLPMITIATVWLGGWHDTNRRAAPDWINSPNFWHTSIFWHSSIAWITVLVNLYAFWKEYEVIAENTRMIAEINELIQKKNAQAASAPAETV
jgi:hypothetical protein